MSKVTKVQMKADLKALQAAAKMAERLRQEAKAAEELYEQRRLELIRKVEMNKLSRSTQLVFNGRILNVRSNGSFHHTIKENGVIINEAFSGFSIHDVRLALATGQI